MKNYDILTIGHISLDNNIDCRDNLVVELGGAVLYSSAASYAVGKEVGAVTKLNPNDKERLNALAIPKEDIIFIPCEHSTSIRNKYFTEDKEKRECTCISQAEGFNIDDIPNTDCKIYHLAGLIKGDFDGELIKELSKRGKVAVDVQGLLRCANGAGTAMYFADWAEKKEILPYIYYLKTDAAEAEILTGQPDRYVAAEMLHSWGAKEIVITHNTEVLAYDGKDMYTCPIKARSLEGRSGRGDTTFAAYLAARLDYSMDESLLIATACVSSKMEKRGPYLGKLKDIREYIAEFYKTGDVKKVK